MRLFRKLAVVLIALGSVSVAQADLILITDDEGQLIGASNVYVIGKLYDVSFVDGTCVDLFGGCDEVSDFTFQSEADAIAASEALFEYVLVDGDSGLFDSTPFLINGCTHSQGCIVTTPFGFHETWGSARLVAYAHNQVDESNDAVDTSDFNRLDDFSACTNCVWADWSSATSVPEPGTLGLFGVGLLALALRRRRVLPNVHRMLS